MSGIKSQRIYDILLFLLFGALFLYCMFHPEFYTKGSTAEGTLKVYWLKLLAELLLFISGSLLIFFRSRLSALLRKKSRLLGILLMILTPGIAFAATVFITRSIPKNYSPKNYRNLAGSPDVILLNILAAAMLLLLFLLITNSMKLSACLLLAASVIFCIANFYVCRFRDIPILASDIYSLKTAASVAGDFSYTPNYECLFALQGCFVFCLLFSCLGGTRLFPAGRRLVFAAVSLIVLGVYSKCILFSDFLDRQNIHMSMFKPLVSYNSNGTYLTMIRSFQYLKIEKPEPYSTQQIAELTDSYPSDLASSGKEMPNIIVIIDEAFSDLGAIADLETNVDYMPFIHSLQKTAIHGTTYASVLGGGTANTEFEVLTGNSISLLPPNCIAFQVYLKEKMSSLASVLVSLGYQGNYAVHPYYASNYGRLTAYPFLGFETYLSQNDFPSDAPRIRNQLSNMAVNDMIIAKYEEAKQTSDAPFFFYTMTMQNHSGYKKKPVNLQDTIKLPEHPDEEVEQYLNLIKHSDEALEALTGYFSEVDEPTVILFLGDHQPKLEKDFLTDITDGAYSSWTSEDMMKQYAVPFILWSNYGLPVKEYEKTSMNYLQSILFENCGLPMTGYQKYLLALSEEIPAFTANGYWGADGNFYKPDDTDSPYYDTVLNYSCILYNNLKDAKNRPENFYDLR